jgi:hypothetical protein
LNCPRPEEAKIAIFAGSEAAILALFTRFDESLRRRVAIENSRRALAPLGKWLEEGWLTECHARIGKDVATDNSVQEIVDALRTLHRMDELRSAVAFQSKVANLRSVIEAAQKELQAFRKSRRRWRVCASKAKLSSMSCAPSNPRLSRE